MSNDADSPSRSISLRSSRSLSKVRNCLVSRGLQDLADLRAKILLALIDDVREAVSEVDKKVSPDELAALVVRLTRAAIESGFSEFADYTAYVSAMISGVDLHLSKIAEHIESAWRMLGQCKEFSHIDPAGNVAEILERREREQWETFCRRIRHLVETGCLRARDHVIEGNLDGAIAEYTKVIEFVPDYAGGYHGRARAYLWKKDFDLAIADYTEAIRLVPRFAEAYCGRGEAYTDRADAMAPAQHSDLACALADYTEAIRLDPQFARAYHNRSNAYLKKGDRAKAESDFAEVERLGPKSGEVRP